MAVLESGEPNPNPNYEEDAQILKEAMDGVGTDEDAIIRVVRCKAEVDRR